MNCFQPVKPPGQERVKILSLYEFCASFFFFQSKCCPFFQTELILVIHTPYRKLVLLGHQKRYFSAYLCDKMQLHTMLQFLSLFYQPVLKYRLSMWDMEYLWFNLLWQNLSSQAYSSFKYLYLFLNMTYYWLKLNLS